MQDNRKSSILRAIENFSLKDLKEKMPREKKKYSKPEKAVEKACLEWMRNQQWDVEIFEAKATYNPKAGIWIQQSMRAGVADCLGSTAHGHMVAVEFKAPKRLRDFARAKNYRQQEFIKKKIASNCFACVVDSVERLETIYKTWISITDLNHKKEYLLKMLP